MVQMRAELTESCGGFEETIVSTTEVSLARETVTAI